MRVRGRRIINGAYALDFERVCTVEEVLRLWGPFGRALLNSREDSPIGDGTRFAWVEVIR